MADFTTGLPQPQAAGAQVFAPVDESRSTAIPRLIGDLASTLSQNLGQRAQRAEEENLNRVMGEYSRFQDGINQGLLQGSITSSRAATMSRAKTSEFLAQYPQYSKHILELSRGFTSETEIGEAQEAEQFEQDLKRQALKDYQSQGGYIPEGASQEFIDIQIETFQANRAAEAQFDQMSKVAAHRRAESAEDRTALDFSRKEESRSLLRTVAMNNIPAIMAFAEDINRRYHAGEDPEQLRQEWDNKQRELRSTVNLVGMDASELASPMLATLDNVNSVTTQVLSGEIDATSAGNRLRTLESQSVLALAENDPTVQTLMATSHIFRGQVPAMFIQQQTVARKFVQIAKSEVPLVDKPSVFGSKSSDLFLGTRDIASNVNNTGTAEQKAELDTFNNEVIRQLSEAPIERITPEMMAPAMDYISSKEFKQYVNEGKIDPVLAQNAYNVFQTHYAQNVRDAITDRLQEPWMARGTIGDAVVVQFVGEGVQIRPRQVSTDDNIIANQRVQIASRLQAPQKALNQLIHAGAHLEGHTNYQKYWEENRHFLMPETFASPDRVKAAKSAGYERVEGVSWRSPEGWRKIGE